MSPVIEVRQLHKRYADTNLLESLPDVSHVIHRGDVVVVTGNGNALNAVTSVLARNQIVARQLRVDQANLEDASFPTALQLLTMAGWAVAFGLAAARFFRWE